MIQIAMELDRPLVRYHGGKWLLAPWIVEHLPIHRVYVEPFGGGGSVLLRKPRSYGEVYNDLDSAIVNLFRVTRDHGAALVRALELTPFSREEYRATYEVPADPIEWARRTVARSFMGFGSNALRDQVRSGFRQTSNRSGTTPAHDWRNYPESLWAIIERLRGVVIENRDAIEVIAAQDSATTVFYCDPPYLAETRASSASHGYTHEMSNAQHEALAERLGSIEGAAVVSGYHSALYDRLYAGWQRFERDALADGAEPRREVLWVSPGAALSQVSFLTERDGK
jgi:DNA adenine methylase